MLVKSENARTFLAILSDTGKITDKELEAISASNLQDPQEIGEELIRLGLLSEETVTQALCTYFEIECCPTLSHADLPKDLIKQIPYTLLRNALLLPVREEQRTVVFATPNPFQLAALEDLRLVLSRPVKAIFCPKEEVIQAINICFHQEDGAASRLIANLSEGKKNLSQDETTEVYDLLDSRDQSPIIKLLDIVLTEAIQQGASDIHFEPTGEGLRIRYRIDGVLQKRHAPAPEFQLQLIARLKVMAKLDIAEQRLPQDGRIKLNMGGREIDFRVSTVPVVGGERIVLRILDKSNVLFGLDNIGMPPEMLQSFKRLIQLPEGIVLVTGPTGSGKTTTLYSALCDLDATTINIMTVEDPVEYKLPGIAQIGIKPKIDLTFSTGLRHILRQDPDVIMIGEIRDLETAQIAIQASLTGHLVLSTLHTNDAPSAITRLVDMGIEPYLLSSSIAGVLAQRLVRRICPKCRIPYTPAENELREIGLLHAAEQTFYKGAGCAHCFGLGYKGRVGIYELMLVTEALKRQASQHVDAGELRRIAIEEGLHSLMSHGAALAQEGLTTIEEVLRATMKI